jgi:hypothetical protein
MSFVSNFHDMANMTVTENGGRAFRSTGAELLDLFANIGGMRNRETRDVINQWKLARKEDKELADNLVLYARDIRNTGLGERKIGRALLKELGSLDPSKIVRNFDTIVQCGRWDDLFIFINNAEIEPKMWEFIEDQFRKDTVGVRKNEPISLLAKWMPSINTSSQETRKLARRACVRLGLTERTYRKALSAMRKHIGVVERLMSAGEWDKINFESVPSVAMSRYISTYNKRCQERFAEYKASLEKGEAKVNAATLFPYDIVMKWLNGGGYYGYGHGRLDAVDEAQWKALPNYVNGNYDVVVLADVSGSMSCDMNRPMATSIGLATYFAQRNKGAYHNMYMTFTNDAHFLTIKDGQSLNDILAYVKSEGVGYNTNLDRAFRNIFEVAKASHEAPKALVVISDMEIDRWYSGDHCASIAEKWEKEYAKIGLESPKLILWNVESRGGRVLARQSDKVAFVSGYGAGSFGNLTELIECNAYDAMRKILTKPAFAWK